MGENMWEKYNRFSSAKYFLQALNEARKEELERILEELDFSQNRVECGFCKTIEQVNGFIEYDDFEKYIQKRLKELEANKK